MIQFMHKDDKRPVPIWRQTKPGFRPRKADFKRVYFMVDYVIYREWTEEFEKAVNWHLLSEASND